MLWYSQGTCQVRKTGALAKGGESPSPILCKGVGYPSLQLPGMKEQFETLSNKRNGQEMVHTLLWTAYGHKNDEEWTL